MSTESPDQLAGSFVAPPINSEQTTQQPVTEEAISVDPSLPQQGSSHTIVPEQVVEVPIEPGMSAPSTRPAEGNTSTSRVMEKTEERQPQVRAQPTFTDAEDRGKALVITEVANARSAPIPEDVPKEDEVEVVLGHL